MIKKSALAIAALMMSYAPQAHADLITELVLVANGATTCTVDVDSGTPTTPTLSAGCTGLTATNDFAHGTLIVQGNWTGTTFTSVSVTSGGYLAQTLPSVQSVADVNITSTANATFETFFTDAFIPVTGNTFQFQGTNNPSAPAVGTVAADLTYDAGNGIPASTFGSPICSLALAGLDTDSCTGANPSPSDTEYSLTTHNLVTFTGGAGKIQTTLTTNLVGQVPEPASIFLLGTLITGLVGLRRQRSKRS